MGGATGASSPSHDETASASEASRVDRARMTTTDERYRSYRRALEGLDLPAAFVDLDVFDRNAARVKSLLGARVTLRVGSKSVRCVAMLRRIFEALGERARGVLAFTAAEAEFLVARGFRDVVVAYPTSLARDATRFATLNADGAFVAAMVDDRAQLAPLSTAARARGTTVPVMLDVDMAWRPPALGARVALGVRRSPLRSADEVVSLARAVASTEGLRFAGLMGYEAQIAGLPDRDTRGATLTGNAVVKGLSRTQVRARRAEVRQALSRAGLAPEVFNGGGTGSLSWSAADPSLTEITVGSGFLGGTLFDGLDEFAPEAALLFALQVTRRPAIDVVTCLGGGYVASGPPGWERMPRPVMPAGLALLAWEGAGEVQTPLRVPPEIALDPGDPVVFRHAKAGELAERFATYHLVREGRVVEAVPTYRGEGGCFL
jgi:D-serine deaminase-like pyridoxal phosphate-dependent protein